MPLCPSCGREIEGVKRLCHNCLETADQSTTSFVPVGQAVASKRIEHSPDDNIYLQVIKGPQIGERFFLDGDRITIGRDPDAQLFLSDITVSREHVLIIREGAEVSVQDLGSLNGTYLNGKIVEDAFLKDGDTLQIGTFQLMFCWGTQ